jgi:hypothetical protein
VIGSTGVQPVGIKKAVRRPQAIITPIIGIIILERSVPTFWV